jgi:eukaryotic-like serine/threonine-protein kinase
VQSPSRVSQLPAPFEVGTVIADKYRIEGLIGSGGMGVVLSAYHLHLGGRVALKILAPSGMKQDGLVRRFFQEARLASRIQSEHVVRVIDVGLLPGELPFIVMEYLEGRDLRVVLKNRGGTLPVEDAIDYTLQAMEAVAEAHNLGIVHRDLKPQNLFFSRRADGSPLVKVLDFGISKALSPSDQDPEGALTHTRGMLGSPLYVSPEQIRSAKHVDVRSDIWSLGVILYEFLTGHPPFRGDTMPAVLASVISDTPVPLDKVHPELNRVILRCLEKSPDKRYSTVGALADELVHFGGPGARLSWERIRGVLARAPLPSGTSEVGGHLPVSPLSNSSSGASQSQSHSSSRDANAESVIELSMVEPLLTFSTSHSRATSGLDPMGRPLSPAQPGVPAARGPSGSSPSYGNAARAPVPSFHALQPPSPTSPSQSGNLPVSGSMPAAQTPPPYLQPPHALPGYGQPVGASSQPDVPHPFGTSSVNSAPHMTAGAWGSSATGPVRPRRRFGPLVAALGGGIFLGTIVTVVVLVANRGPSKKVPATAPDATAVEPVGVKAQHVEPVAPAPTAPTAAPEATVVPEATAAPPGESSEPATVAPAASAKKRRDREKPPGAKPADPFGDLIKSRR